VFKFVFSRDSFDSFFFPSTSKVKPYRPRAATMVSKHYPTYILLALYVLAMIIVAIIANRKNRKSGIDKQEIEDASEYSINANSPNQSVVTTHFLASKAFGKILLLLTTFATVFSGYTVVGVPNEAGTNGFIAIKWITAGTFVGLSILFVFPRIRRISVVRNYESPGDFINDRFNCYKPLCVLVSSCLCIPPLLDLAVNIYSLGVLLEYLTGGELTFYVVVIICTILILVFEALGGMRSVAYTDAVQATVMVFVFLAIPIVIGVHYGGFVGQVQICVM